MLWPIIIVEIVLFIETRKGPECPGSFCMIHALSHQFYNSPWKKTFRVTALAAFTAL